MNIPRMNTPRSSTIARLCLLAGVALAQGGCSIFGLAASAMPEPDVPAKYTGLKGQSVAVMVWADRGVQIDYPALRLDVATGIQGKIQQARNTGRGELKNMKFPYPAASVVRFQEDHPDWQEQPITDVARRLGVDRLIYVEIEDLRTRADETMDLYRGTAVASLKVIEVDRDADTAKAGYEESSIGAAFPPSAPPEGFPGLGDERVYRGTVDRLTTFLAVRFFGHPKD